MTNIFRFAQALVALWLVVLLFVAGCEEPSPAMPNTTSSDTPALDRLLAPLRTLEARLTPLKDLHQPLGAVHPGDWRSYWSEPEKTPRAYVLQGPNVQTPARKTLHVLPIGDFSPAQKKILSQTRLYLAAYFSCPVVLLPARPTASLPSEVLVQQEGNPPRLHGPNLLDRVLKPMRQENAWGLMAITNLDLYAGRGLEGTFGETLLFARAGLCSMARFGNPDASPADYAQVRTRTIKCATHETAHLLSLNHCRTYRCGMNGRAHLKEFDAAPTYLCPSCLTKLIYALDRVEPETRFEQLAPLAERYGLPGEATYFRKAGRQLQTQP